MGRAEEIQEQWQLLRSHRATLAAVQNQIAMHGEASAPPGLLVTRRTARAAIKRIKIVLRRWREKVEDHPDDLDPDDLDLDEQIRRGLQSLGMPVDDNQESIHEVKESWWTREIQSLKDLALDHLNDVPMLELYAVFCPRSMQSFEHLQGNKFHNIIDTLYEEKDHLRVLTFVGVLVRMLHNVGARADQHILERWYNGVIDRGEVKRIAVEADVDEQFQVFQNIQETPISIAIIITVMNPLEKTSISQWKLRLHITMYHPYIGFTTLRSDDQTYALSEVKELIREFHTQHTLPRWAREDNFLVEFVVPLPLLRELYGVWNPATWNYICYNPYYDPYDQEALPPDERPIGAVHPVVVRFSERLKKRDEGWRKRWARFVQWRPDTAAVPFVGREHPCFEDPVMWREDYSIVGMVADTPLTRSEANALLQKMLRLGLPIGIWLNQPAAENEQKALHEIPLAHDLPKEIQRRRASLWKHERSVGNLMLLWDDESRIPPDGTLRDPHGER